MKDFLKNYGFKILAGLLILGSVTNVFLNYALSFENKAAEEITLATTALYELETVVLPLAESIPIIKSWGTGIERDFDSLLSYLNTADVIILIQMILLKISHWWVFKAILIICFAGLFIPSYQKLARKILIIGLLISPGIAMYTHSLAHVSQELSIDLGSDLKDHLTATKDSIQTKKDSQKAKLDSLIAKQKEKNNGKLNIIDKVEDDFIKGKDEVTDELEKIGKDVIDVLRFAGQHGLELAVALIGNIIVIFLVLPLLFWYLIGVVVKRQFGYAAILEKYEQTAGEIKALINQKSKES
ncbi:hypothetical protein [Algoriphagus sediminis]|uniref:DUF4064 domain-containing protein n=1 Tax=Algoriphagus sediminis TaxID=3057113 RepID=A0ABT7YE61_9BACT|nr:hypothetical protein [Algoriphagus sediminis]MDN3204815.1 hypothetical protein [Algoriphagus sediminis]